MLLISCLIQNAQIMENVKGHLPLHNSVSGTRVKIPL